MVRRSQHLELSLWIWGRQQEILRIREMEAALEADPTPQNHLRSTNFTPSAFFPLLSDFPSLGPGQVSHITT